MLTDFPHFFTDRLIGKFAQNFSLIIPPHLNCVIHYLVKYQCSKNVMLKT